MQGAHRFFYLIGTVGEREYFRLCREIRPELLDIFGRGYVIDHCLEALERQREARRYRSYVTDALMVIAENTARFAGGRRMNARWADGILPANPRSGDAIALEVLRRAGLTIQKET